MKRVLLMSLLVVSGWAYADTNSELAKVDADWNKCLENPENQNTVGMKGCTEQAWQGADVVLNKVYKNIVAGLKVKADKDTAKYNAETLKRLIAAERAWITYRDTNSSLAGTTMLFGTGEGLEILTKLYTMTVDRTKELDQLFNIGAD